MGVVTLVAIKYEDEVVDFVRLELGNQLSRSIDVGAIEYDLFESFPNVSVSLNHVKTYSFEKGDKPFLDLQRIYLVFNLLSVITGELSVNKIILEEGQVNIILNKEGVPNYNILKETKDSVSSNSKFSIENVMLTNVNVGYFDWKENQEYGVDFIEGTIKPISLKDSVVLEVNFTGKVCPIKLKDFKTSKNIPLDGVLNISIKKEGLNFKFKGGLNESPTEFKGLTQIKTKKEFWDFEFELKNHSVNSLLSVLPESLNYNGIKSIVGVISAKVFIKGEKTSNRLPALKIEYQLNKTNYKRDNHDFEEISATGVYTQPNLNKSKGSKISVSSFIGIYEGIKIAGSGILSDFKRPLIEAEIQSEFQLNQIHKKLLSEDFKVLSGTAFLDINLRGRLIEIFANNNFKSLDKFKSEGTLILDDLVAQPKDFDYPISILNGKLNFTGKNLRLESFEGRLQSTTFKIDGLITNYLKTILVNEPLTFDANLQIDKMALEDFVGELTDSSQQTTEKYNFNLPKSISLRTHLKMGEFTFRKFKGKEVSGEMNLKNQILTFNNLKLKTCNGEASLEGSINTQYPNKVVYKTKTILKVIDAKKAFYQFENFGQDVLLEHHVNGKVSLETNLIVESDKELNIDENKIFNETKLTINNGELVRFEPLIELQDFLNKDLKLNFNLSHLKFQTLKNDIKITNSVIYIPEMAIRSSDINLDMQGTHTFEQEIDYLVKIKHSEIFKAKRQNKIDIEFGVLENKDKTATLPLRMKGNIEDPKFTYDMKSKRELVKETLKKEGQHISKVLKKEFTGIFKSKEKKKKSRKEFVEEETPEDLNEERLKVTQELVWDEDEE